MEPIRKDPVEKKMRQLFKRSIQGLALTAAATLASTAAIAADKVTIAEFKYPAAQAKLHLVKMLIEERFGLEVSSATGDNAQFYAGMDRGKGDYDLTVTVWLPNQKNFKAEYVDKKKTVVYSEISYPATSGFCVPKHFSEQHNVTSIFDLARPEVAELLDSDGNGKGEIWIGKPGWASTNENHIKVRDYGLLTFNEAVKADAAVNFAALADAVKKKQGRAFYCWRPNQVWIQYDVVQLEEPTHDPSCHNQINAKDDPEWFEKSKITCASAPKKVTIGWAKALEERLPVVTSFLANIELDTDTVSAWAYEIAGKKRSPAEVVREWAEKNQERIDKWLGM